MPTNAIRRTAAEAPVTNFNPSIPGNPFISLPVRARSDRVASYSESSSSAPYSRSPRLGTLLRSIPAETLHVRHPGHTFDSEWDFNSRHGPGKDLERA